MSERKYRNIGGLWAGVDRNGRPFWSGNVEIDGAVLGVIIRENPHKKPGSRQPDFIIVAAEDELVEVEDQISSDEFRDYPF